MRKFTYKTEGVEGRGGVRHYRKQAYVKGRAVFAYDVHKRVAGAS